jgi:hypothetical protein
MIDWEKKLREELAAQEAAARAKQYGEEDTLRALRGDSSREYQRRLAIYQQLGVKTKFNQVLHQVWGGKGELKEEKSPPSSATENGYISTSLVFRQGFNFPGTYKESQGRMLGEYDPGDYREWQVPTTNNGRFVTVLRFKLSNFGASWELISGAFIEDSRRLDAHSAHTETIENLVTGKVMHYSVYGSEEEGDSQSFPIDQPGLSGELDAALVDCLVRKAQSAQLPTNFARLLDVRFPGWKS